MLNKIKAGIANIALKFVSVEEKLAFMFLETSPKHLRPVVILPAINTCMKFIVDKLEKKSVHGLINNGQINDVEVSVIQTHMGSPNTAVILEILKLCRCKTVIRIDYCGGLKNTTEDNKLIETELDIGNIVIPKEVFLADGTSYQYLQQYAPSLINNPFFQNYVINDVARWKYPNLNDRYWSVKCESRIYDLFTNLDRQKIIRTHVDRLWTTDSLFCEPNDAIDVWKRYGCNSIDMESGAVYLLGALFNIPAISILGVSDLSDSEEFNLFTMNKIHPGILTALSNIYEVLWEGLPKVHQNFVLNE